MTQEFVMYFLLQTTLLNSCSDTHTPISDEDYNMTKGTVILRSPSARVSSLQGRIRGEGAPAPLLLVHQWKYGEGEGEEEVEERRKNGKIVEEEIRPSFDSVLHPPLLIEHH